MLGACSAAAHWLNQPSNKDTWSSYSSDLGASSSQQAKAAFAGAMVSNLLEVAALPQCVWLNGVH
jgi:hypothetical protein